MRSNILFVLITSSLIYALSSANRSLQALMWITFMRPQDFTWNFWRWQPLFQVSVLLAYATNILAGNFRIRWSAFFLLSTAFFGWSLVTSFTAFDRALAVNWFKMFCAPLWLTVILLMSTIHTLKDLRILMWVVSISAGLVSFKIGVVHTLRGGATISDRVNGFVGDNNTMGLCMCLIVALLMGLRADLKHRFLRWGMIAVIAMTVATILYTRSRGGFLTLGLICLSGAAFSRHPVRNVSLFAGIVIAGFLLLPSDLFSRLETLQNIGEEGSAMGRIQMWDLAIRQFLKSPIFGYGVYNFRNVNLAFWPELFPNGTSLVTHSVYFQILAAMGLPGLLLYMALISLTLLSLHKTYRLALSRGQGQAGLEWVSYTAFWLRNGFAGYCFGAAFLDMLGYDYPWFFMCFCNLLHPLFLKELRRREKAARSSIKPGSAGGATPGQSQIQPAPGGTQPREVVD